MMYLVTVLSCYISGSVQLWRVQQVWSNPGMPRIYVVYVLKASWLNASSAPLVQAAAVHNPKETR